MAAPYNWSTPTATAADMTWARRVYDPQRQAAVSALRDNLARRGMFNTSSAVGQEAQIGQQYDAAAQQAAEERARWNRQQAWTEKTYGTNLAAQLLPTLLGYPLDIARIQNEANLKPFAGVTMPGLPKVPSACKIDLDDDGKVVGLF